jgi:hypothetical protein
MNRKHVLDAMDRLAEAEARAFAGEFLAPALRGAAVVLRVEGVVCRLATTPRDFEGWGVFRPISATEARPVRPAGLAERRAFLALFPAVRLVLAERRGRRWLALPADGGGDAVPVDLVADARPFDAVRARFDGARVLFESIDPRRDPGHAAYLRASLAGRRPPDRLDRPGLTPGERAAYALAFGPTVAEEAARRRDRDAGRLRRALGHAGARLLDYAERGGGFRVTYEVDGVRHVSAVARDDLTVRVAGICLSGEDRKFDLASLVGVLRQGRDGGLVRVGAEYGGIDEGLPWDIPPGECATR